MSRSLKMQKVLKVMEDNIQKNIQPGFVSSSYIANELDLPVSETKQLLKAMNDMGLVQSSMEVDYSIVTRKGFANLQA